jgi:hypothetical protein
MNPSERKVSLVTPPPPLEGLAYIPFVFILLVDRNINEEVSKIDDCFDD